MSFIPVYSDQATRLQEQDNGGWEVHDRALEMQRAGADVILLCVGDPDFRTPEPIIDNAVSYLRVGRTHYSPALGEIKFRRAVADLETHSSPHPCDVDEVAIFPGATSAIHAVMTCLLNAGDEIVIPEPMYVGYPSIMQALDARVVAVPLDVKSGFGLNLPLIKSGFTDRTRVLFLNTPGNPTGSIISAAELRELKPFTALSHDELFLARTGYTGEDGYEILLPGSQAEEFWNRLLAEGVAPCGLGARDSLRLEAGMNLYGHDMDEGTSPLVSGLSWTVAMKDDREFIGRAALEEQKREGVPRKLVGLLLEGRGVLREGQTVITSDGEGITTSGGFSPTLQKAIAFARIPAKAEGSCEVEIRGKYLPAKIVSPPFVRNGKVCDGIL